VSPIGTEINTIVNNKRYVPHATGENALLVCKYLKSKWELKPAHSYDPYVEYELLCESQGAKTMRGTLA
jgi:hypothetical protein